MIRVTCALEVWWIMRIIGYHDKYKTGLLKTKSPKSVQSLGLVKFQVPSPQKVNFVYLGYQQIRIIYIGTIYKYAMYFSVNR